MGQWWHHFKLIKADWLSFTNFSFSSNVTFLLSLAIPFVSSGLLCHSAGHWLKVTFHPLSLISFRKPQRLPSLSPPPHAQPSHLPFLSLEINCLAWTQIKLPNQLGIPEGTCSFSCLLIVPFSTRVYFHSLIIGWYVSPYKCRHSGGGDTLDVKRFFFCKVRRAHQSAFCKDACTSVMPC